MDNGRLVGRDGEEFPYIHKFRLPADTIQYSSALPREFNPEHVHMCAAYDTERWQPVKFEFKHKSGHDFFTLTFMERLTTSVEVVILKA